MENKNKKADLLYQVIYDSTRDKFAILPILAGLTLALVAFGISGGLFPLNNGIKGIATILLLLMIMSIQVYYSETIDLLTKARGQFYGLLGTPNSNQSLGVFGSLKYLITGKINGKAQEGGFFKRFSSQFPALAILILWFVVFFLILQIWRY